MTQGPEPVGDERTSGFVPEAGAGSWEGTGGSATSDETAAVMSAATRTDVFYDVASRLASRSTQPRTGTSTAASGAL